MENFAPVLITTLNRSVHFKNCVESLSHCTLADKTVLYIALDYPLHEGHRTGYEEIKKYLPNIKGFQEVIIIERDRNFGAVDNFFKSLDEVFEKYDRVIISEDDNVFSKNFLTFINTGLEVYVSRADIFSISGYQYPVKVPKSYKDDVYIWNGFSAWGVGIWKEKWQKLEWDLTDIEKWLSDNQNVAKLNCVADHIYPILNRAVTEKILLGDAIISYYLIKYNIYSIFPVISKVRNTGHDGSGTNCSETKLYRRQKIDESNKVISFIFNIKEDNAINKALKNHFSRNLFARIKRRMVKMYYNKFVI